MWKTIINLFKKKPLEKFEDYYNNPNLPEVKIGDIFVEKIWEDTELKIVAISKNKKEVRYIYTKIKGDKIIASNICETSVEYLLFTHEKINSQNDENYN